MLYINNLSQVPVMTKKYRGFFSCVIQGSTCVSSATMLVMGNFSGLSLSDDFKVMLGLAVVLPGLASWFGRARKDEKSEIREEFLGEKSLVRSDVQSNVQSCINDGDQDELKQHTLSYKITRQMVYFSFYLYATIMSIRLVLVYHKLDEYLQNQEQNRPFLALFQTVQIIPSIFFGYTYSAFKN